MPFNDDVDDSLDLMFSDDFGDDTVKRVENKPAVAVKVSRNGKRRKPNTANAMQKHPPVCSHDEKRIRREYDETMRYEMGVAEHMKRQRTAAKKHAGQIAVWKMERDSLAPTSDVRAGSNAVTREFYLKHRFMIAAATGYKPVNA